MLQGFEVLRFLIQSCLLFLGLPGLLYLPYTGTGTNTPHAASLPTPALQWLVVSGYTPYAPFEGKLVTTHHPYTKHPSHQNYPSLLFEPSHDGMNVIP